MPPTKKTTDDDTSLKRLGSGRWQTRDQRFTIEPQSGTWVLVDGEQTDDLGLPLVRGPFRSLTAAKEAIATARTSDPPASPLAGRVARGGAAEAKEPSTRPPGAPKPARPAKAATPTVKAPRDPDAKPAAEPRWLTGLEPADRRRARRLIEHLEAAGDDDSEGLVKRDLVGDVPSLAVHAIGRGIAALVAEHDDPATLAPAVAELLADGRDGDLDVRWHLVDDRGRTISLTAREVDRAIRASRRR